MSEQSKDSNYKEYGHLCHDVSCWCQEPIIITQYKPCSKCSLLTNDIEGHMRIFHGKGKWHGTTLSEDLYQRIAQLALEHKRSVIKEIEYIIEKGLLWLESEDQV